MSSRVFICLKKINLMQVAGKNIWQVEHKNTKVVINNTKMYPCAES